MKRALKYFCPVLIILGLSCCAYAQKPKLSYDSSTGIFSIPFGKSYNYADILVEKVFDGDTLLLANGERVRLIGIDTPEMHDSDKLFRDARRSEEDIQTIKEMGKRAYEFTKKLVDGKQVKLEFDAEKYDVYNRLLAYVYLEDGTFVNAEIIKEGYASPLTIPPNTKYSDLFLQLYQQARENKRGLWRDN